MEMIIYKFLFLIECLDVLKLFLKKIIKRYTLEEWSPGQGNRHHTGRAVSLLSVWGPLGQRK